MVHKQLNSSPQNVPALCWHIKEARQRRWNRSSQKWLYTLGYTGMWNTAENGSKRADFLSAVNVGYSGQCQDLEKSVILAPVVCRYGREFVTRVTMSDDQSVLAQKRYLRKRKSRRGVPTPRLDSTYFDWCENKSRPLSGDAIDGVLTGCSASRRKLRKYSSRIFNAYGKSPTVPELNLMFHRFILSGILGYGLYHLHDDMLSCCVFNYFYQRMTNKCDWNQWEVHRYLYWTPYIVHIVQLSAAHIFLPVE
jgi:hypothetical protein